MSYDVYDIDVDDMHEGVEADDPEQAAVIIGRSTDEADDFWTGDAFIEMNVRENDGTDPYEDVDKPQMWTVVRVQGTIKDREVQVV